MKNLKHILAAILIAGSAWADMGTSSGAGIPNPASAACVAAGGIEFNFDADRWGGAQDGVCRTKDNALIASATLMLGGRSQAAQAFLAGEWHREGGSIDGWANQNCEKLGGRVIVGVEHLRADSRISLCEFPDHSRVETWTLFEGPGYYPTLTATLKK